MKEVSVILKANQRRRKEGEVQSQSSQWSLERAAQHEASFQCVWCMEVGLGHRHPPELDRQTEGNFQHLCAQCCAVTVRGGTKNNIHQSVLQKSGLGYPYTGQNSKSTHGMNLSIGQTPRMELLGKFFFFNFAIVKLPSTKAVQFYNLFSNI